MAVRSVGLKLLARTLGALAGAGAVFVALPCCGIGRTSRSTQQQPSAPPPRPLELLNSDIAPAGKIHVGDTLYAIAQTSGPRTAGHPIIYYSFDRGRESRQFRLYDDGTHGDNKAKDGVWNLKMVWDKDCGTGKSIQIRLALVAEQGYALQSGATITLDVEQARQGASARRRLWPK